MAEALRNLASSRLRSVGLAAVALVIGAAVALLTTIDVTRIATTATEQERAGAFSFQVVAPGGGRPDAKRCHEMNSIDGVLAAGGVMSTTVAKLDVQPDSDVRILTVTPGFIASVWSDLPSPRKYSAIAGSAFTQLGWNIGSTVAYTTSAGTEEAVTIDTIAATPSMLRLERVLVTTAPPTGTVEGCLVTASPKAAAAVGKLLQGWFGDGTSVQDVLIRSSLMSDPQQQLGARISQFGWLAGAFVIAAVLLGGWTSRRAEFALYRLLGFKERAILSMLIVDTLALAILPAQLGALIAIGARQLHPLVAAALTIDWLRIDLLVLLLPILGILSIPRRSLLGKLKGQ
jgi:hypothetical protein